MSTKHTQGPLSYTRLDSDGEVDIRAQYGNDSASVGRCYGVGNGRLLTAGFNSYAKHCKDPVAAAESDLLGRALEVIRTLSDSSAVLNHLDPDWNYTLCALLAETKEGA